MQHSYFAVSYCEPSDNVTWTHNVTKTGFRQNACLLKKTCKQKAKTKLKPNPNTKAIKKKKCIGEKWEENGDYSLFCLTRELLLDPNLYSTSPFTTTFQINFETQDKNW